MKQSFKFIYLIAIVGVIVIVVMLGLFIMKSSQDFIDNTSLTITNTNEFSSRWKGYEGKQKGSKLKIMLQQLASNAEESKGIPEYLPDVAYKATSVGEFSIINSTKKFNNSEAFNIAANQLDVKHYYYVQLVYDKQTKNLTGIVIKYENNDKIDFVPDTK